MNINYQEINSFGRSRNLKDYLPINQSAISQIPPTPPIPPCYNCQDRATGPLENYCGKCQVLRPLMAGHILGSGRFIIQRTIGQGGMGRVFLAQDRAYHNQVVIKELLDVKDRPLGAKEEFRQRLEREAEILESLYQLRSIPRLLQRVVYEAPRHYYVMEYIDGTDLYELVTAKSRPLPVSQVVNYALEIGEVLKLIHNFDPPLVHRDIKPQNLRLRHQDGSISLLDFGIARQTEVGANYTTMLGTYGYTAPEQYAGNAEPRSDLYSLAATMYFLLTQTTPGYPRLREPGELRKSNPDVTPELEKFPGKP